MNNSTARIFGFFARTYPLRTGLVILSLFLMAIMEMFGIVTLLPLISLISEDIGAPPPIIAGFMTGLFDFLHLPLTLPYMLVFIVAVMILKALLMLTAMWQVAVSAARVVSDLRFALLRNVLGANWSYYTTMTTGGSVNALGTEALRSADVYQQACNLLAFIMLIVVYAVLALMVSWKVTLAALAAGTVIAFFFLPLVRFGRHYGQQETRLLSDSSRHFSEALTSVKPIRAMGREAHFISMLSKLIDGLEISQKKKIIATDTIKHAAEPVIVIFVAIGLYFSVKYTVLPLTQLLFLAFLFHRLATRMIAAQRVFQGVVVNESALNVIRERIDEAHRAEEVFAGAHDPALTQAIEFENVSFSYDSHEVLKNISVRLDAHKLHAVIGGSGAGKTTFVDLVIGLHRPASGQILLDGVDLTEVNLRQWRSMIGYVPQDVMLFHDTVYRNVTLGDETISREDAKKALKAAGAWPFVEALENGLDEVVGEGGGRISGGQRQRIAIARAIVHKPVLLILDEATSALDKETEKGILEAIRKLTQDMTVIAIAHQDSVLAYADNVLRLENGVLAKENTGRRAGRSSGQ